MQHSQAPEAAKYTRTRQITYNLTLQGAIAKSSRSAVTIPQTRTTTAILNLAVPGEETYLR